MTVGQNVTARVDNVMVFVALDLANLRWQGTAAGRAMMDALKELMKSHQDTIHVWLKKVQHYCNPNYLDPSPLYYVLTLKLPVFGRVNKG